MKNDQQNKNTKVLNVHMFKVLNVHTYVIILVYFIFRPNPDCWYTTLYMENILILRFYY